MVQRTVFKFQPEIQWAAFFFHLAIRFSWEELSVCFGGEFVEGSEGCSPTTSYMQKDLATVAISSDSHPDQTTLTHLRVLKQYSSSS